MGFGRRRERPIARWWRVPQAIAALVLCAWWVNLVGYRVSYHCHDNWHQDRVGDRNAICAGPSWRRPTHHIEASWSVGNDFYFILIGAAVTAAVLVVLAVSAWRPNSRLARFATTGRLLAVGGTAVWAGIAFMVAWPIPLAIATLIFCWHRSAPAPAAEQVGVQAGNCASGGRS